MERNPNARSPKILIGFKIFVFIILVRYFPFLNLTTTLKLSWVSLSIQGQNLSRVHYSMEYEYSITSTQMTTSQYLSFFNFCDNIYCILDQRLDLKKILGEIIPKKLQSCLLSFISATCYLYNTTSHEERLRKQQHSIFYLFLFIEDHVHNNFYIVMFHFVYQ